MNISPEILVFEDAEWAIKSATLLTRMVSDVLLERNECNIILTGGRSAERVYKVWAPVLAGIVGRICFYFGDERCVEPDDQASNFRMVMQSLFPDKLPGNFMIQRIRGEAEDIMNETERYGKILPQKVDIVLLSIGEDGHIASLFPNDKQVLETGKKMLLIQAPKFPQFRLSVSANVIQSANRIFCFVNGPVKGEILKKVFQDEIDVLAVPARLACKGVWLMDKSAMQSFDNCFFSNLS